MLIPNAIALLQDLIRLESFSGSEEATATRIEQWFSTNGIPFQRKDNNVWATNKSFDPQKPINNPLMPLADSFNAGLNSRIPQPA